MSVVVVAVVVMAVAATVAPVWISRWVSLSVGGGKRLGIRQGIHRHQAGKSHQQEEIHIELEKNANRSYSETLTKYVINQ